MLGLEALGMNGGQRQIFCAVVLYLLVNLLFAYFLGDADVFFLRKFFFFFAPCGRLRKAVLEGWGCTDFKCCCVSL